MHFALHHGAELIGAFAQETRDPSEKIAAVGGWRARPVRECLGGRRDGIEGVGVGGALEGRGLPVPGGVKGVFVVDDEGDHFVYVAESCGENTTSSRLICSI